MKLVFFSRQKKKWHLRCSNFLRAIVLLKQPRAERFNSVILVTLRYSKTLGSILQSLWSGDCTRVVWNAPPNECSLWLVRVWTLFMLPFSFCRLLHYSAIANLEEMITDSRVDYLWCCLWEIIHNCSIQYNGYLHHSCIAAEYSICTSQSNYSRIPWKRWWIVSQEMGQCTKFFII